MSDLKHCAEIKLMRCANGWLAHDGARLSITAPIFVFESTESLARALPRLIGQSKWEVQESPARDEKGHFLPRKKEATHPPHIVGDVKQ